MYATQWTLLSPPPACQSKSMKSHVKLVSSRDYQPRSIIWSTFKRWLWLHVMGVNLCGQPPYHPIAGHNCGIMSASSYWLQAISSLVLLPIPYCLQPTDYTAAIQHYLTNTELWTITFYLLYLFRKCHTENVVLYNSCKYEPCTLFWYSNA